MKWILIVGLFLVGCAMNGTKPTHDLTMDDICRDGNGVMAEYPCEDPEYIYVEYYDELVGWMNWYYDMVKYRMDGDVIPLPCLTNGMKVGMRVRITCYEKSGIME